MADSDYQRERRRLAALYAGMADGELDKLAKEAVSLSEAARDALQLEISRRQTGISPLDLAPPAEKVWPPGPITLRRYRDLPEALLAKSILDSASVECFLADENMIRMNWLLSNLLGGVKLWVRPEDADAAELLANDEAEA
jgi:hypothetical protein